MDFTRGSIHVRRSGWEGHVTLAKGGRARQVNMTARPADALRRQRHLGVGASSGGPTPPEGDQVLLNKWMNRIQRLAKLKVTSGIHPLRHTFCSRLAMVAASAWAIHELAEHPNHFAPLGTCTPAGKPSQQPAGCQRRSRKHCRVGRSGWPNGGARGCTKPRSTSSRRVRPRQTRRGRYTHPHGLYTYICTRKHS